VICPCVRAARVGGAPGAARRRRRPDLLRCEAEALADIHSANLHATDLGWLPEADREYLDWTIERQFFRWAWEKAVADPAFVR